MRFPSPNLDQAWAVSLTFKEQYSSVVGTPTVTSQTPALLLTLTKIS